MAELLKVLKVLEDLETNMGKMYVRFMEFYGEDAEAVMLFERLSRDEDNHRDFIRYQRRIVTKNPGDFKPLDIDIERIQKISELIESICDRGTSLTLDKAVMAAIQIEKDAAESLYREAISDANTEIGGLIQKLNAYDIRHMKRLNDFALLRGFLTLA